ncbi:hypothetical protein [Brevundimonas aurifodinae]|jgi:hypothetical protein|uniref:Uncharacterized protein n=2 Tax=Brevundimonas TaxID=41275 RepID=A0ABV1NKH5_9CAUL|nr:MAG: hypothetical protein B7Z42_04095 [Brevundimonas sp. 12-68-7]OYX31384.1 MAG: hypothetical protein B7Z01_12590 [Brevundimonas subvibrioides]
MIKSVLAAAALAVLAPTALAQTAPAQDHSNHAAPATARPTIASPIKDLLNNAETAAVMEKHLPGVAQHPMRPQFEDMTLAQVMPMSGGMISQATVDAIDADLKALPQTPAS